MTRDHVSPEICRVHLAELLCIRSETNTFGLQPKRKKKEKRLQVYTCANIEISAAVFSMQCVKKTTQAVLDLPCAAEPEAQMLRPAVWKTHRRAGTQ